MVLGRDKGIFEGRRQFRQDFLVVPEGLPRFLGNTKCVVLEERATNCKHFHKGHFMLWDIVKPSLDVDSGILHKPHITGIMYNAYATFSVSSNILLGQGELWLLFEKKVMFEKSVKTQHF